ncbi:YigZ family protein [Latilactobacillus fuchuensis]|uniref:YigZ family protein n=1 Tax=Latilactobacillus fuchuensis TaxID=164393 RepID=UPI0020C77347|nr:YigZ family protein [Latilactobacillus fuchuensis]MCP8857100.1 YigZ family protein [Latilactobacillus fuchuensis]
METYFTVKTDGQFELIVKKSRFICQVARVTDENSAQAFIEQVRKSHPKANHNCFAYQLGQQPPIQKQSDDGEPSGTAGVPMLEVLRQMQLTNLVVVVTRYFGGIKLGTGGLIRAYSHATSSALTEIGLVQGVAQTACLVTLDYSQFDALQNWLAQVQLSATDIQYAADIQLTVWLDTTKLDWFKAAITEQLNGRLTFVEGPEQFNEVPISPQDLHALTK